MTLIHPPLEGEGRSPSHKRVYARVFDALWRKRSGWGDLGRVLINFGRLAVGQCPLLRGDLNRSTQHFILEGKDGVWRWIRDFVVALVSAAHAENVEVTYDEMAPLTHNGSLMLYTVAKNHVEIRYETPKAGLPVSSGAVLFKGARDANHRYIGTAYTFKRNCPPAPYTVTGSDTSDGTIVLVGLAPRRKSNSCRVVPGAFNSNASRLVFEFEPEPGDDDPKGR